MAKIYGSGKWKRRWAIGLSVSMAAVLSLGVFAACNNPDDGKDDEDEESAAMPADTQLLKNGNFEFYSEMTKEEDELRAILNTPTSWSFSSGSPSSDTKSGLLDLKYWESFSKSKYEYKSVADAYANWDEGNIYDRLNFFYKCDNPSNNSQYDPFEDAYEALSSDSAEKKFFREREFSSVDFEDVKYLRDELGSGEDKAAPVLHGGEEQEGSGVLMIHNRRTSDGAVGTAQSYSSSTSISLAAGTSAKISVWVKTANLRHYYSDLNEDNDSLDGLEVTSEAGAYIGVTQTVGGTTLDQMQIKNINTAVTNKSGANNGWEQYTVYVRASTFASTTVKLVLGLGQGNSDDRYEAVNGYALFDDAQCEIIENGVFPDNNALSCNINSKKNDKLFDATELYNNSNSNSYEKTFSIDLYAANTSYDITSSNMTFGLTEEKSGNTAYTSAKIDPSLDDNSSDSRVPENKRSIVGVKSLTEIKNSTNGYLQSIAEKDFKEFPFKNQQILLLLSTNGAAYTAKSETFILKKDSKPLLISFFVKTSEVITGRTGATINLVDGETKTAISAFDSTKIATVDITNPADENKNKKDIYNGWVQCFFFVSNDTDSDKTYSLEFSLGPTSIASSDKYDYGQGYAAFANFETRELTKTELSYASTGDRAKKVSLTGITEDTTVFDSVTATSDIEHGLGTPVNFKGVLAGSDWMVPSDGGNEGNAIPENKVPEGLITGLLNYKNVENYYANSDLESLLGNSSNQKTWEEVFGDSNNKTALQPLVIKNTTNGELPSYGYFASNATISASSYQKISLRVKLSAGAKATVYLTDVSEFSNTGYNTFLKPGAPKITYWYDSEGNICNGDPSEKETEILFELQKNGLYSNAKDPNDKNYYANLQNYKTKEGDSNLYLGNGTTVAFYGHDGKYFAYRTEKADGSYTYEQEVTDLCTVCTNYRYDYSAGLPEAKIEVVNNDATNATDWITVAFYVHTGNEAKDYRLEVWAGDRDGKSKIPANGYVFFDRYSSASISNYDTLLKEAVADLEEEHALDENGNLPSSVAQYYTFTFYDSANYLRYDVNEDVDEVGNLYASYDQSAYSEEIIYLEYDDEDTLRRFINYAASDVTVEADDPAADDDKDEDKEDKEPISTGDILLIVSSALLGIVLIFVVAMLLVRHFTGKRRRSPKANAAQDKRYRPSAKKEVKEETEEEENPFVKNRKAKEAEEAKDEADEDAEPAEEIEAPAEEEPAETEPDGDEE